MTLPISGYPKRQHYINIKFQGYQRYSLRHLDSEVGCHLSTLLLIHSSDWSIEGATVEGKTDLFEGKSFGYFIWKILGCNLFFETKHVSLWKEGTSFGGAFFFPLWGTSWKPSCLFFGQKRFWARMELTDFCWIFAEIPFLNVWMILWVWKKNVNQPLIFNFSL